MSSALWNLGFRPFYLLASVFAVFSVLLWIAQFSGFLAPGYLRGSWWHPHEMLFGYTTAVIAGFLLTAVRNWTQRQTASGIWLMALAALWVGGRIVMLTPFDVAAAVINAAFPFAIALAIGIPLIESGNARNYFFVGLLTLLGVLVLVLHLTQQTSWFTPQLTLQLALDAVLFLIVVLGGRVIPMFTNNAIPGAGATRDVWTERLALGMVLVLLFADLLRLPSAVTATVAFAGALSHGVRLGKWKPWRTVRTPLVWILHAAYAWIVIHLVLRGFSELELVSRSLATHALTIGAIGGMTLGMMTRTARGHTGRPLHADRYEVASYLFVQGAAIVRVGGGIITPSLYAPSVQLSGLLWAAAYSIYAVRYWPVLTQPRVDGKPG